MSKTQYTIRNIPPSVDRYLRKRAKISGRSLNQIIIEELSERAGVKSGGIVQSLDWFIGGGVIDETSQKALEEDDAVQKELTRKEWSDDDY